MWVGIVTLPITCNWTQRQTKEPKTSGCALPDGSSHATASLCSRELINFSRFFLVVSFGCQGVSAQCDDKREQRSKASDQRDTLFLIQEIN